MKKLYATIGLFIASLLSAQVPQAFSYQTIAFNASGAPIVNGNVALRISILDNSATGTVLYTETQSKTTNSKGLVNLNIGQGTATTGSFGGINWGTNTKFVKVEMDPQGGSNYTNVGVNQLMSVPYSQVSKTVVTGAGQGITLVSPNGTSYILGVNDGGTMSLPQAQSGSNNNLPQNLYLYGSYNSFNASNAELLRVNSNEKYGYKYFPANSQIKFITAQNTSAMVYGSNTNNILVPNGNSYNITSNGFYQISIKPTGVIGNTTAYTPYIYNFTPYIYFSGTSPSSQSNITYDVNTNTFSIQINGVTSLTKFKINLGMGGGNTETIGDNLSDGNFDINGQDISFPGANSTLKNYKLTFTINFDATGTYTIVQI
ncbi:cadherin repeat domain-containing protein [Chryseobacterium polytrichastri]|uniref:Uncharacterized protein n=1 Tax=Chryseobacterium polytrichastri TaxID=1302687 RepID=A0A1M6VDM5_9FLAO|nr:hypothetical protein [Chryseobacterium polytrichastri]SHK79647.1 hypothetical protein SAMN05444267_10082 [Chryseobacterium polytrichastri]